MARYLITSALPYINGIKHLGNLAGSMLYERQFFSDDWTVRDEFASARFCDKLLALVSEVAKAVCGDVHC